MVLNIARSDGSRKCVGTNLGDIQQQLCEVRISIVAVGFFTAKRFEERNSESSWTNKDSGPIQVWLSIHQPPRAPRFKFPMSKVKTGNEIMIVSQHLQFRGRSWNRDQKRPICREARGKQQDYPGNWRSGKFTTVWPWRRGPRENG